MRILWYYITLHIIILYILYYCIYYYIILWSHTPHKAGAACQIWSSCLLGTGRCRHTARCGAHLPPCYPHTAGSWASGLLGTCTHAHICMIIRVQSVNDAHICMTNQEQWSYHAASSSGCIISSDEGTRNWAAMGDDEPTPVSGTTRTLCDHSADEAGTAATLPCSKLLLPYTNQTWLLLSLQPALLLAVQNLYYACTVISSCCACSCKAKALQFVT